MVEMEIERLVPETVGGVPVVVRRIDLAPRDLASIASRVSDQGGVALLVSGIERAHVVLMSGSSKVNAGGIIGQVCGLLGGKGGGSPTLAQGGGPDIDNIELALKIGKERIFSALHD